MNQHPAGPTQWTYDEYARLPDDGDRYEIIQGEVCVTPGPRPRHQWVTSRHQDESRRRFVLAGSTLARFLDPHPESHL
jgi:hypothetical protein